MKTRKSALTTVVLGTLLLGQSVYGASTHTQTPTASSVVAAAEAKAASANKNVLVIFHASWCGWCHKLDDFLESPQIAPIMDANYVTIHIVVQESEDKKDLNNPGGDELLDQLGGKNQGIPYYAILSPTNKTLAVSKDAKGNNLGYPGEPAEIPVFMQMIRTTSHHLSGSDADLMDKTLVEDGAKIQAETKAQLEWMKPIEDAMSNHDYKSVVAACDSAIVSHPKIAAYARYMRFQALLHVDEDKALADFGQSLGDTSAKSADRLRAAVIVNEDGLSDRAYNRALAIILATADGQPESWSTDSLIARAYARVHQLNKATEYQDKAIQGAKKANVPQRLIDDLVKTEQG